MSRAAAAPAAPGNRRPPRPAALRRQWQQVPPEGVPIAFTIASLGSRFGAQLLDILLTYGGAFLLLLALLWAGALTWTALAAFFALASFFIRVPYYALAELVWNGRTLGKRIVGIRVVSLDGRRLTPHQIVARNLMKEVEVFLPIATIFGAADTRGVLNLLLLAWFIGVLFVPVLNRRKQRLGDMLADTIVVDTPRAALLPDLSTVETRRGYEFTAAHLDVYGRYELQVLEEILRVPPKSAEAREKVGTIAQTIRRRIGYDEAVPPAREWDFLMDFYRDQREFLESRHLFGDSREDKFYPGDR
ncbi:Uncharacterized membrane protein YckC, RDD family [Paracoccus aminovorans]|uniref:Uncharacterized membrane protein YckC, RDD family n=1 Tax=Paracoccus aminovorans TaxID=34004 RepID=A0A1I3DMG0_9RHOB|nr:RDD family protein [Paracoccus aminovorans]SFH87671.1 Uncharacterized membrane protein YckC, RDD family [Paracoccus aminovorans]